MSSVATDTGPLIAPTPPPVAALAGNAQDVAAWLAYVGLEGRYAVVRKTGVGQEWWRYSGARWDRCDERLVRAAATYALEHAYHRLPLDDVGPAYRLDRLLNHEWIKRTLWPRFTSVVHVGRERLGLR